MKLAEKKCIPCEDNSMQSLSCEQVNELLQKHHQEISGWQIQDNCTRMQYVKMFPDFVSAMQFVNQIADIAESQGHHPNISVSYNQVTLDLWTHSINGLSENDFILASLINSILQT